MARTSVGFLQLTVAGQGVRFQLDTGATCNVLRKSDVAASVPLQPTSQTLAMYSKDTVKPLGKCRLYIENPRTNRAYEEDFIVVREAPTSVLGAVTTQRMGLVQFIYEHIQRMEASPDLAYSSAAQLLETYQDVFYADLGCLESEVNLETDPTVRKIQLPVRMSPVAIKQLLKELDRLQSLGVVEKVDRLTVWVSSLVIVKKPNGNIRICLDPQPLNLALKNSHYPVPTLTDILPEPEYLRSLMPVSGFGMFNSTVSPGIPPHLILRLGDTVCVSPAPEIFQRKLHQALVGLPGVHTISNDILVVGNGLMDEVTMADHDDNLTLLLERCGQRGIKLNKGKLRFRRPSVTYLGHILTCNGLFTDPLKTKTFKRCQRQSQLRMSAVFWVLLTTSRRLSPTSLLCANRYDVSHEMGSNGSGLMSKLLPFSVSSTPSLRPQS